MPTTTWDNLDEGKRHRVLIAAMREFGRRGFSAGSINVIARDAGIAKGSVFQYFTDKRDLYAHVSDHVSRTVRDEFTTTMLRRADDHHDLFALLRAVLTDWVAYFRDHPLERDVLFAILFEIDADTRRTVRQVVNQHQREVVEALVWGADASGQLREGVSRDHLVALLLLLVPHLATAPFSVELDPVLDLSGRVGVDLEAAVSGYVDALEAGFGVPAADRRPADLAAALLRAAADRGVALPDGG